MTINEVIKQLGFKPTPDSEKDMEQIAADIGHYVTELRIIKGITQKELASLVGTKQSSIARLENGYSLPSLTFLFRIAKALDTYILPPQFGIIKERDEKLNKNSSTKNVSIGTSRQYKSCLSLVNDQ